jgi:predicted RNA-binding protein (virulence factor B family)
MTKYYLSVLKDNVSICLDTDVQYHHHFKVGDIIPIHMYSDKGPKVVFGGYAEYNAEFTLDWNKTVSTRLSIAGCITKGIMADITLQVDRDFKLKQLGI